MHFLKYSWHANFSRGGGGKESDNDSFAPEVSAARLGCQIVLEEMLFVEKIQASALAGKKQASVAQLENRRQRFKSVKVEKKWIDSSLSSSTSLTVVNL